jgi:hypothetical protein
MRFAVRPAPQKGITKIEAVRRALAHFGNDAKPSAMSPWIKQQFGIEVSPNHISASRGAIQRKHKQAGKARPAAKKAATPKAAANQPAPKPPAVIPSPRQVQGDISLPDIEAVKGLVHRVSPEQLRALVDLLAR